MPMASTARYAENTQFHEIMPGAVRLVHIPSHRTSYRELWGPLLEVDFPEEGHHLSQAFLPFSSSLLLPADCNLTKKLCLAFIPIINDMSVVNVQPNNTYPVQF